MPFEYEVALSFAGEDRPFAEAVANGLKESGVEVFYDDFYKDQLWGEELSIKLREVYRHASRFCIMIITRNYLNKMWPTFERRQIIERLIHDRGNTYVLPVRLDGFLHEVPGLPETIGYLSVRKDNPQEVTEAFLGKIGKKKSPGLKNNPKTNSLKPHIPRLVIKATDKEKRQFLKSSFAEIVTLIEEFSSDTQRTYPHFDYDVERIQSNKALFTLYQNGKQLVQFKIWIGGILGGESISFYHGTRLDPQNDNTTNESLSIEDHEGELKLKPIGFGIFGGERENLMSPREAAQYLWEIACKTFS